MWLVAYNKIISEHNSKNLRNTGLEYNIFSDVLFGHSDQGRNGRSGSGKCPDGLNQTMARSV